MQALMDIVARVKIAAQHALELVADHLFDHFSRTGVMVFIVAHGGRTHAPDRAVRAIFAPARFIGLHGGARTDRAFEIIQDGLGMLPHSVQDLHNLANAHLKAMQTVQQLADLANRQAHHRAQVRDTTG